MTAGAADPAGGEQFGRYRLLQKLASGGMGEIFLARLEGTGGFSKLVVIKRLLPALVASPEFVTMFLHEARIAAELSHANICDVYELGQVDGRYFIAMQYLQGVAMSRLAAPAAVDASEHVRLVTGLAVQACEGLQHAHDLTDAAGRPRELVHRDISPSNLMVTFDGALKLLDFGIAQAEGVPSMTSNGSIRGKFAYMSPEQIRGEPLDRRTDLFSLGIVLFETLTRRRLFQRPSEFLVAKAILEEPYPVPHQLEPAIPPVLSYVLGTALAKPREQRYQQAREMRADLAEAMVDHGGPMTPAEIADALRQRFADDLAEQSEQFERATEQISVPGVPAISAPAGADQTPATRSLRGGAPLLDRVTESAPLAALPARRSRRWLPLVLAGATLVAAVVAWLALRATGSSTDAPSLAMTADAAPVAATPPLDALPSPAAAADAGAPPPVDAGTADARSRRRPGPKPKPRAKPQAEPGYFTIDSDPYATIYIDGQSIGPTPIIRRSVAAGRHTVRAVREDGRSQQLTIRVRSEQEIRRRLRW